MEAQTELITMTVKEFTVDKGFTQIVPVVRTNVNGYPYLTFITEANVAENVYFSKAASVALAAGQPVTKEMLSVYQIGITHNAAGEERFKLITNSDRIDISELF